MQNTKDKLWTAFGQFYKNILFLAIFDHFGPTQGNGVDSAMVYLLAFMDIYLHTRNKKQDKASNRKLQTTRLNTF